MKKKNTTSTKNKAPKVVKTNVFPLEFNKAIFALEDKEEAFEKLADKLLIAVDFDDEMKIADLMVRKMLLLVDLHYVQANGGFEEYLKSPSGNYLPEVLEFVKELSLKEQLSSMQALLSGLGADAYPVDRKKRQELLGEPGVKALAAKADEAYVAEQEAMFEAFVAYAATYASMHDKNKK